MRRSRSWPPDSSGWVPLRFPVLLLFGQAGLGLALGVVWWALTRHPSDWLVGEPIVTSSSSYPIARDGTYAALSALAGVAAGVVLLARRSPRPIAMLVLALAGALTGSLLGAGLGSLLPPADGGDPAHVTLQSWAVVLVWPLVLSVTAAIATLAQALGEWVRHG